MDVGDGRRLTRAGKCGESRHRVEAEGERVVADPMIERHDGERSELVPADSRRGQVQRIERSQRLLRKPPRPGSDGPLSRGSHRGARSGPRWFPHTRSSLDAIGIEQCLCGARPDADGRPGIHRRVVPANVQGAVLGQSAEPSVKGRFWFVRPRRRAQLGNHPASVGHEHHFAGDNLPHEPAEMCLQLTDANRSHGLIVVTWNYKCNLSREGHLSLHSHLSRKQPRQGSGQRVQRRRIGQRHRQLQPPLLVLLHAFGQPTPEEPGQLSGLLRLFL